MAKSYDELQFTDDVMFGKVMEDRELCRDVLECLLQEPVGTLQNMQQEREFQYTSDGKPIRLDVYFLQYISTGIANSPLTQRIAASVETIKKNEKWRSEYMKEWIIIDDARREGINQGIEQGIYAFIHDKLDDGVDTETIIAKLQKSFSLTRKDAEKYLASVNHCIL